MILVGKKADVDRMKAVILKEWKGKDLKKVDMFVGIQVERNRAERSIRIHQTAYTTKILERFGMSDSNPVSLPMPAGTVLEATEDGLLEGEDISFYKQIVGATLYLSNNTRPDIAYPVGQLARFMSKPATVHLKHAKHLLKYLNGTRELGIIYSNRQGVSKSAYDVWTDATWGTEKDGRASFGGWAHLRYGGAVNWSARRQKSTALSSMHAEIMSACEGSKEMAWMEKLRPDIDPDLDYTPTLFMDNQSGVNWFQDHTFHDKAKHIEIQYFYVRNDMLETKRLKVQHVPGTEQIADVLTKQLAIDAFKKHTRSMGMGYSVL
jgi:hypothetical protein